MNTILTIASFTLGWLAGTVAASSCYYALPLVAGFVYLIRYAGSYQLVCISKCRY